MFLLTPLSGGEEMLILHTGDISCTCLPPLPPGEGWGEGDPQVKAINEIGGFGNPNTQGFKHKKGPCKGPL